jgi:hypothetical protein
MKQDTIDDRLKALYAEMDAVIDRFVDERYAASPGVPRESVRRMFLARARDCKCEEFSIIQTVITTAEELAKKQAEHALPEG